jgi:hypothetical protein
LAGDSEQGISILTDLFIETRDAAWIFNQGRCYEQNGLYRKAGDRFREYLRLGGKDVDLAKKHIDECEALAASPSADPFSAPGSRPAFLALRLPPTTFSSKVPGIDETHPPAGAQISPAPLLAQPDSASSRSRTLTTGLVVGGVGTLALLGGLALNLEANDLAHRISPPNTFQRGTESERKTCEELAWISYGVGAVGLATGAVLSVLGWHRAADPSRQAFLLPDLGPGRAGAVASGTF